MQALVADALLDSLLPVEMINTDENRRSLSPLFLATSAYPPTFLIAPQLDTLIAPTQAYLMADRLKELGVEAIVRRANYAPHAYDRKVRPEHAMLCRLTTDAQLLLPSTSRARRLSLLRAPSREARRTQPAVSGGTSAPSRALTSSSRGRRERGLG